MSKESLTIEFNSGSDFGEPDTYDLGKLSLPVPCARCIGQAFHGVTVNYRTASRRQTWTSVRKFAAFLRSFADPMAEMTRADTLERFAAHLKEKAPTPSSRTSFNFIVALYRWLSAYGEQPIRWMNVKVVKPQFAWRQERARATELDEAALRRIASACKREIDRARSDLELRGKPAKAKAILGRRRSDLLKAVVESEKKGIYTVGDLRNIGIRLDRNSLRAIRRYKEPTCRTLLPYELLIMVATAANPWSIMDLRLGCIEDHPTDPMLARFFWHKARAYGEQVTDTIRVGQYSLPSLITDLRQSTRHLRKLAPKKFEQHVFLARSGRIARPPAAQSLHNALKSFIKDNNLPRFTFADIRRSLAAAIHARGEGLDAVRQVLQHRSARTTERYLDAPSVVEGRTARVLGYQGQLIAAAEATGGAQSGYDTAYGFTCADPNSGRAVGSRSGEPCLQFAQCATCNNALFLIDSPEHVARIMKARTALEEYRLRCEAGNGSMTRFNAVFAQTLAVADEVLNHVRSETKTVAESLSAVMASFPLEE